MSGNELNKVLGIMWKALSPDDKKEYIEQGEADKRRYVMEVALYNMQSEKKLASR